MWTENSIPLLFFFVIFSRRAEYWARRSCKSSFIPFEGELGIGLKGFSAGGWVGTGLRWA
jgi:hypothetical protein